MKIYWSQKALESFYNIFNYLSENRSKKALAKYVTDTEKTINLIKQNPETYPVSEKNKKVRNGFVNKFVSMFYMVNKKKTEIDIVDFWEKRQNPKKLKY